MKICCVIANEYLNRLYIQNMIKNHPNLGSECQFFDQELYEHKGQYFCKFHLPLSSKIKRDMNLQNEVVELLNLK